MDGPEATIPGRFTPEQAAFACEIQQRIYYYGWCIDHRRFADLDALFLPDAVVHYDTPGGTRGPWPEIREWLSQALAIFRCTQHNMTNPMIVFGADDAEARSTTYGHLIHFQEKVDGSLSMFRHSAVYRDRWARVDGLWRIRERTLSNVGEDGPVLRPPEIRLYPEAKPL